MPEIVIIGAGPAGMSAAVYAARAGFDTLVLERLAAGGQVAETTEVENYPGFLNVGGLELAAKMREQAIKQGAKFQISGASSLAKTENGWSVALTNGTSIDARAVIVATGASRRKLDVPGEKELAGAGVSYCATCDGGFFKGREVAVAGGGSTAFEDALYLARICSKVYMIHRRDGFRAEKIMVDEAKNNPKIEFVLSATVQSIDGNGVVDGVTVKDVNSGAVTKIAVAGLFVAVGTVPNSALLSGHMSLDAYGYAEIGEDCDAGNGLFVAGDLRKKPIYQIVSAVSDGAVAATGAARFLQD